MKIPSIDTILFLLLIVTLIVLHIVMSFLGQRVHSEVGLICLPKAQGHCISATSTKADIKPLKPITLDYKLVEHYEK